jgi:hypothetical protein
MPHAYLFIPGYDERGVYLDSFLDITSIHMTTPESLAAAERLGVDVSYPERMQRIAHSMMLRARFASSGSIHKVTTEEPIERDDLEALLTVHFQNHTLRDFLHRSRV